MFSGDPTDYASQNTGGTVNNGGKRWVAFNKRNWESAKSSDHSATGSTLEQVFTDKPNPWLYLMLVSPDDFSTYGSSDLNKPGFGCLVVLNVRVFVKFKGNSLYNPSAGLLLANNALAGPNVPAGDPRRAGEKAQDATLRVAGAQVARIARVSADVPSTTDEYALRLQYTSCTANLL